MKNLVKGIRSMLLKELSYTNVFVCGVIHEMHHQCSVPMGRSQSDIIPSGYPLAAHPSHVLSGCGVDTVPDKARLAQYLTSISRPADFPVVAHVVSTALMYGACNANNYTASLVDG